MKSEVDGSEQRNSLLANEWLTIKDSEVQYGIEMAVLF